MFSVTFLKRFSAIAIPLFVSLVWLVAIALGSHAWQRLETLVLHHITTFFIFRWVGLGLLLLGWSSFVQFVAHRTHATHNRIVFWQHQRVRILVWALLTEGLLIQNPWAFIVRVWS